MLKPNILVLNGCWTFAEGVVGIEVALASCMGVMVELDLGICIDFKLFIDKTTSRAFYYPRKHIIKVFLTSERTSDNRNTRECF